MKSAIARTANAMRSYVPCVALRCVAWLVTAAAQRNAQQRSTSNATQRAAQRMWTRITTEEFFHIAAVQR